VISKSWQCGEKSRTASTSSWNRNRATSVLIRLQWGGKLTVRFWV
jgi:hypothetical protein